MAADGGPGPHLYIRKRPLARGEADLVERRGREVVIQDPAKRPRRRTTIRLPPGATWWEGGTTNDEVWQAFERSAEACAACEGPGALWMAYGQTGSGKTHTLTGTGSDAGLLQRALRRILATVRGSGQVRFRAVQLHNESPACLLTGRPVRLEHLLSAGGDPDGASGAGCEVLRRPEQVGPALARAAARREVGRTALNDRSSRAHTIYLCDIEAAAGGSGAPRAARAAFLDLAGNEKDRFSVAAGRAAQRERAAINQSLFALKECIRALHQRPAGRHVPFRRSKLTLFLQSLLDQRLALHFVATIHPTLSCLHDSTDTLRYATTLAAWSAPPPPADRVPVAAYESFILKMYSLLRRDADLHQACRREGRDPPRASVLRLLSDKLRLLQRSRRVFAEG